MKHDRTIRNECHLAEALRPRPSDRLRAQRAAETRELAIKQQRREVIASRLTWAVIAIMIGIVVYGSMPT